MSDEKSIKDLVKGLMKSYRLGDKYDEIAVINSWDQIAGKLIAQKTKKIYIRNKTLYLNLDSAALKNELLYHKLVIIEKVNTFAGKEIIREISIY